MRWNTNGPSNWHFKNEPIQFTLRSAVRYQALWWFVLNSKLYCLLHIKLLCTWFPVWSAFVNPECERWENGDWLARSIVTPIPVRNLFLTCSYSCSIILNFKGILVSIPFYSLWQHFHTSYTFWERDRRMQSRIYKFGFLKK